MRRVVRVVEASLSVPIDSVVLKGDERRIQTGHLTGVNGTPIGVMLPEAVLLRQGEADHARSSCARSWQSSCSWPRPQPSPRLTPANARILEVPMTLTVERDGPVTTIIRSRIAARNAMDPASAEALTEAFLAFG